MKIKGYSKNDFYDFRSKGYKKRRSKMKIVVRNNYYYHVSLFFRVNPNKCFQAFINHICL